MIINVFLLHNKQHRTLSFPESGWQANYICTVGELCICCFCNQPTNPSRFLRPDYCSWQLISLLNSRAGSRGEKLSLLKSVAKSCSFYLSQDFSLNLLVSEWAEWKILSFLSVFLEGSLRNVLVLSVQEVCKVLEVLQSCPALSTLCWEGRSRRTGSVCAPRQGTWHSILNSVPGGHPFRTETHLNNTPWRFPGIGSSANLSDPFTWLGKQDL